VAAQKSPLTKVQRKVWIQFVQKQPESHKELRPKIVKISRTFNMLKELNIN